MIELRSSKFENPIKTRQPLRADLAGEKNIIKHRAEKARALRKGPRAKDTLLSIVHFTAAFNFSQSSEFHFHLEEHRVNEAERI